MSEPTLEEWSTYLEEIKEKLHISPDENDDNLKREIEFAHAEIQGRTGSFPLSNKRGRGLVFEYVRFLYNGQGEYFVTAYASSMRSFSWELYDPDGDG